MGKDIHACTNQKKAGVAMLILDKVDFIEVKSLHDDKGINSSSTHNNPTSSWI